jgi:uncharacterized membrane protein YdjX (TVP38/TMEM64 family)
MADDTQFKIKSSKHVISLVVGTVLTIVAYFWFIKSPYFPMLQNWFEGHEIIFFTSLIVIKIVGIVWPPMAGGLFTLGAIPIVGWLPAYLSDAVGSIVGSSIAFWLAKHYGRSFMDKLFDEASIQKILKLKIKDGREIEAVFTMRLFGGSVIELICYGAGLLGIKYRNFVIGSVVSHAVIGIPFYYFTNGFFSKDGYIFNLIYITSAIIVLSLLRKRYFVFEE